MKISFFLKIGVMILALAGVFYSISALKTGAVTKKLEDPGSALGLLIGSDYRPTNWCPAETIKIDMFDEGGGLEKTLTEVAEISSLCETMMGAFSGEGIADSDYRKRLEAINNKGENKIMEQVPGKPIFRSQGMPFGSPMLLKSLARLANP